VLGTYLPKIPCDKNIRIFTNYAQFTPLKLSLGPKLGPCEKNKNKSLVVNL
jgi:hypothetical protein